MRGTLFLTLLMGDSKGYDAWAQQIAAGEWMGREVFYQAPLYPYLLAAIFGVFGHDLLVARLVQAAIGAASCGLLGYAAGRLFGHRVGVIAGVMLAVYPPAIFFDGLIQKSVLDVFFVCLALALCAHILNAGASMRHWIAVGVAMGALSLTRENALLLAAVIACWAYRASGVRAVAVFAIGVMVMVAPVALRNYAVSGEWHLTTSQFGSNLYIGNNPKSDGSYMSLREGRGSPEFERVDATQLAEKATGTESDACGSLALLDDANASDTFRRSPATGCACCCVRCDFWSVEPRLSTPRVRRATRSIAGAAVPEPRLALRRAAADRGIRHVHRHAGSSAVVAASMR